MVFQDTHPKAGEPLVKDVEGDKEWKYCIHHKKWGRHSGDECRLSPNNSGTTNNKDPPDGVAAHLASIFMRNTDNLDICSVTAWLEILDSYYALMGKDAPTDLPLAIYKHPVTNRIMCITTTDVEGEMAAAVC